MKFLYSLIRSLADFVFGYDLFVSYSRRDWGDTYALELVRQLSGPPHDFRCFLDAMSMETGDSWRRQGARALRKSSKIVLLLTEGALDSPGVLAELEFNYNQPQRRRRQISVVNLREAISKIDRSSDFYKYLTLGDPDFDDKIFIEETSLQSPSATVAPRIGRDFTLRRESTRRLSIVGMFSAVMVVVASIAVWLAFESDAARRESDARRLSVESTASPRLELSLLLAAASHSTADVIGARQGLLRAHLRRPRLTRVLPRVGAVKDMWLLASGQEEPALLISHGRADANHGHLSDTLAVWPLADSQRGASKIRGFAPEGHRILVSSSPNTLAAIDDDGVSAWRLNRERGEAALLWRLEGEVLLAAAQPDAPLLHVVRSDGRTSAIDLHAGVELSSTFVSGRLFSALQTAVEDEDAEPALLISPVRGRRAIDLGRSLWLETATGWKALDAPNTSKDGLAPSGATFSTDGSLIIALRSRDATPFGTLQPPANIEALHCWSSRTGKPRPGACPSATQFKDATLLGATDTGLLISASDPATGGDLLQLWEPGVNHILESITLRAARTLTQKVAFNANGLVAHLTVDGEITVYDRSKFLTGSATPVRTPIEPLVIDWGNQRCELAYRDVDSNLLVTASCADPDHVNRQIPVGEGDEIIDVASSSDRRHVVGTKDETTLLILDASLREIATLRFPEPADVRYETYVAVSRDESEVFVVTGGQHLWRFSRTHLGLELLAHIPGGSRSITLLDEQGLIVTSGENFSGVTAMSTDTGEIVFRSSGPGSGWNWVNRTTPSARGDSLLVQGITEEWGIWKIDTSTGRLISDDLSRYPGPAFILATSHDDRFALLGGTGLTDEAGPRSSVDFPILELWDHSSQLPLATVHGPVGDRVASFSPTGDELIILSASPPELLRFKIDFHLLRRNVCRTVSRDLTPSERARYKTDLEVCPHDS